MKEQKKGIQLNQAFGAVLTIVLVALLVIIAIVLFGSLSTTMVGTLSPATVTNEVDVCINDAAPCRVAKSTEPGFSTFVITSIRDRDDNSLIGAGNYTYNQSGYLFNKTETTYTQTLVSYTYKYAASSSSSNSLITQFSNYPALIGLVGTIIFLALVIGVLVASFAFGGKSGV